MHFDAVTGFQEMHALFVVLQPGERNRPLFCRPETVRKDASSHAEVLRGFSLHAYAPQRP